MNALQLALRYLERRARTEKELRQKLADRQVPPQEIEAVLVKLKGYGYINDVKFARDWQRSRDTYKPMGARRLRIELQLKGIPKEIVQTVQAEQAKEVELAYQAAESRLRQYSNLDSETFRRRMTGFLARRGFSYSVIKLVFEKLESNSGPASKT